MHENFEEDSQKAQRGSKKTANGLTEGYRKTKKKKDLRSHRLKRDLKKTQKELTDDPQPVFSLRNQE